MKLLDAVQSVGKIKDWQKLNQLVDVYSYSAHKFGALKGIGFSFVKKTYNWKPLIIGGGQQNGLRSGTENLTGILSIEAALKDLETKINLSESLNLKNKIISLLKSSLGDKIVILLENEENTAVNTISFIHKEKNADLMLMQFDLNGIDVSFGSACSSGSFKMTQSLRSFGLGNYEKSFIRISFGVEDYENPEILDRLNLVFNKLK